MKFKKIISVAACVVSSASLIFAAAGCNDSKPDATPPNTDPYDIPQDYCRTYYEVFVRSFADGNGDGIGDIRGLIDNLDYLNDGDDTTTTDLGINGIWMMPINTSPSYHKYDVANYRDIDDEYGTLADFDDLVEECDKRGIWLQMDLVLNHTSSEHPWFKEAVKEAKSGEDPENGEYMSLYNFVQADSKPAREGTQGDWFSVSGSDGYYYWSSFDRAMPDRNLQNERVRDDIADTVDFWLERGIKSFRLDAVPWANATAVIHNDDNAEFWTWFNDYCDEKGAEVAEDQGWANDGISRYCYNVGEVWGVNSVIVEYFATGMSNFNYDMGGGPYVGFSNATQGWTGYYGADVVSRLVRNQGMILEKDPNGLLSNFLSNHDNNRSAGYFDYNSTKIKKAAALYLLAPGNPYIYYGEELGMSGAGNDESKRLHFLWGDGRDVKDPDNADYDRSYVAPSQTVQTTDYSSVLTYYRNAIKLRNRFPEIGRGVITGYALNAAGKLVKMTELDGAYSNINALNGPIAAYTLTWKDRTVLIVHNIGESEVTVDASAFSDHSIVGSLNTDGGSTSFDGSMLRLSAGTVAVMKAGA